MAAAVIAIEVYLRETAESHILEAKGKTLPLSLHSAAWGSPGESSGRSTDLPGQLTFQTYQIKNSCSVPGHLIVTLTNIPESSPGQSHFCTINHTQLGFLLSFTWFVTQSFHRGKILHNFLHSPKRWGIYTFLKSLHRFCTDTLLPPLTKETHQCLSTNFYSP